MAIKPFLVAAPRWILVAIISGLVFLLGLMTEQVRDTARDNQTLMREKQEQFEDNYSKDVQGRLALVEERSLRHSKDLDEFRLSMREFAQAVSAHNASVRELSFQVKMLGNKIESSRKD